MALATFGAGCFWGVELTFSKLPGVTATSVGYMGGHTDDPTYKAVCSDTTGHAEVVQIEYDPERLSYERLLNTFFHCHDPTQLNRQGPDFRHSISIRHFLPRRGSKKSQAQLAIEQQRAERDVVTQLMPAATYYLAEDYHQKYLEKRGMNSCGL